MPRRAPWRVVVAMLVLVGLAVLLIVAPPYVERESPTSLGGGFIGYDRGYAGQTFIMPPPQNGTQIDPTASVSGFLVDASDAPVRGVEVELIPLGKTGDQRWYATQKEWTNAEGAYRFPNVEPGEYILGVFKIGGPDGQHPFAGMYFPGVEEESQADHMTVTGTSSLELRPLRLSRLETVTLKVNVEFEDGTRPAQSNLCFHNPSYPNQAVIGDVAPQVDEGRGEFTLPAGFEYYGRASVACDTGSQIETRESRPVQHLRVTAVQFPTELTFVIPGPACKLWTPE